jgi:hypothetical protein
LRRIIANQYDPSVIFALNGETLRQSADTFKSLSLEQRMKYRVIVGHTAFYLRLHEYMSQPCTYITIIREPIDRIISHYYFVIQTPHHYLHKKVVSQNMSLKDYVLANLSPELDNGQTKLLATDDGMVKYGQYTEELLEIAKDNILKYFSVIGVLDRFDAFLMLLRRTFGWEISHYVKENVTINRPNKNELAEDTLSVLEEHNQLDIRLYKFVRERMDNLTTPQNSVSL